MACNSGMQLNRCDVSILNLSFYYWRMHRGLVWNCTNLGPYPEIGFSGTLHELIFLSLSPQYKLQKIKISSLKVLSLGRLKKSEFFCNDIILCSVKNTSFTPKMETNHAKVYKFIFIKEWKNIQLLDFYPRITWGRGILKAQQCLLITDPLHS